MAKTKLIKGKHRVVDDRGRVIKHTGTSQAKDGGGYMTAMQAEKHAQAENRSKT